MIATARLIEMERAVLDQYGKTKTGSQLAEFVAKRTRLYLVQEIEKAIRYANSGEDAVRIVRGFRDF